MFVKICGIRDRDTALWAAGFGADALGFVFHRKSPRFVEVEKAWRIAEELKDTVKLVAVYKDPEDVNPDVLHFCHLVQVYKPIKNVPAERVILGVNGFSSYPALYYLLDLSHGRGHFVNHPKDLYGLPKERLILSGGLNSGNVSRAITRYRPFGVDVSSGVERAPGIKSKALIEAFIKRAKEVCA